VSVTEHLGGAAVTTIEAATGSIKAEQRRPREGEKKTVQDRGKKPNKTERKKIHRAKKKKIEKTQTKKPKKTNINITVSSIPPCKSEKGRTQSVSCDLHHHRNKRKTEGGSHTQTRTKSPCCKPPRDLQKQVSRSHSLFILVWNCANVRTVRR
jgi:hypothetical protein